MNERAGRIAPAATIRVRNFRAVEGVLRDLGVEPVQALSDAGLPADLFSDPERAIPFASLGRLMTSCVAATGRDDFGLRAGCRETATAVGLAGLVTINSPTVREALQTLVNGLRITDTGSAVTLHVRDGVASLGYSIVAPDVESADQITDGAIAIAVNIMRQLCGSSWSPDHVFLTRPPTRDATLFARFFGAPVEFGAPSARIEFAAATLGWVVTGHSGEHREILAPLLDRALAEAKDDFVSAVKAIVRAQVAAGGGTRKEACAALGVSVYALTTRLRNSGTSFESLVDGVKRDLAKDMLAKGRMVRETGAALGFADQSAFTRAFKRWTGATPARWQAERTEGAP